MLYTVASDFHQNAAALDYIFDNFSDTQIVLLGDFFDTHGGQGMADAKTMATSLINHVNAAPIKPILLTGNHDNFIIGSAFMDDVEFQTWMMNGGKETLRQLGYHGAKSLHQVSDFLNTQYPDLLAVLKSGKYIVDEENILFVHAGVDWNTPDPIRDTNPDLATWIREGYLFDGPGSRKPHRNTIDKTIVSGHTPIQNFDRSKTDAWVMHHPLDKPGVNRYLIDGGSGSGATNAHVNILQFNELGQLTHQEAFGL